MQSNYISSAIYTITNILYQDCYTQWQNTCLQCKWRYPMFASNSIPSTGIHSGTGMNIGIPASNSIYVHAIASTGIIPCRMVHASTCIAFMSVLLYILVLISRANTDIPCQYWYTYQLVCIPVLVLILVLSDV